MKKIFFRCCAIAALRKKSAYSEMKSRCEAEIEKLQKELTSIGETDTIETRKVIDIKKTALIRFTDSL